jgi:hypothetical protein
LLIALMAFAVVVVVFTLLLKRGVNLIGAILGRTVSDRHHAAEHILNTGTMPDPWIAPFDSKMDALEADHELAADERSQRLAKLEADAKRHSLRRIDDLLRYFARAPVFADDHSREVLMNGLREARATWVRAGSK